MVIFNCDHMGFLSQMLVLRYKFHKNEKAILLIAQDHSKTDIYHALEEKKIFDIVIPYNSAKGCLEGSKERVNQAICNYFDNLFQEASIDLTMIDKVYIACDILGAFGIYAYNKRIKYSMVEVHPGQLTAFIRYTRAVARGFASKCYGELLQETSALSGDEKLTEENILVIPRPQDEDYSTSKRTIYLDYTKELANMSNEIKMKVLRIYNVNSDDIHAIDTLVLTNSRGVLTLSGLPEAKFPYLYQLLLDYYVTNAGNIVIKRHPNGLIHFTGTIPGVAGNLNGNFPIEFIAFFQNVRIKNVVVVDSNAIDKIKPYVDNLVAAGGAYFKNHHLMHQLYVAYSLVESIGNQNINFRLTNNFDFFQRYLHYVFPQYRSKELKSIDPNNLEDNVFTVIDSCPPTKEANICNGLQKADKDAITVFLNSNNSFDFYDIMRPELLDQMIPVKITKTAIRDDILADLSDEYIYVFSKDSMVREKVRAFSMSKTLYYTGIEIKVTPLQDSEIDLIKMEICLKGIGITLKKAVNCLTKFREVTVPENSEIDLIKQEMCLKDIETATKEFVNCLTEW